MIAELGSPANPDRSDYKNNLCENQIKEAQLFLEDCAAFLNIAFKRREL